MLDRLIDLLVRRMLHPPRRTPRALPESLRARAEDVSISAGTGPIAAWRVPAVGRAVGTVVLVHGWGGDAGRMALLADPLVASGLTVLLVDLPGHGRTALVASYNVKLMVDDLRAVRDWIAARNDPPGRAAAIVGFSFGGLGAYVAASRDPRWAALVVLAAPQGAMEAIRLYLDGKGLPAKWLDGIVRRSFIRAVGAEPEAYDADRNLASIRVPVLIVHGEDDRVVPVWHAERLAAAVPEPLGTLVVVPGMSHSGVLGSEDLGARIAEFLSSRLARTGDTS
jgi:alpha-beta hydrolase superfamily lysophospholipase